MINHDFDYVSEHSQRVIVITHVEIFGDGTPRDIFKEEDMLKKAQIEPPQITQLDRWLDGASTNTILDVQEFINKYTK